MTVIIVAFQSAPKLSARTIEEVVLFDDDGSCGDSLTACFIFRRRRRKIR